MGKLTKIVCYNEIELWHSRKNALKFFNECARNSDGAERDRYINIIFDLEDKVAVPHDGSSYPIEVLEEKGRIYNTTAPDHTRDYGGKIWYAND